MLNGKTFAEVKSKLNRRIGQLRRASVVEGKLKADCELETFRNIAFLIERDTRLADLVDRAWYQEG